MIAFPIAERTLRDWLCAGYYNVTLRGNTLVDIEPKDKDCPFKPRLELRSGKAPCARSHAL